MCYVHVSKPCFDKHRVVVPYLAICQIHADTNQAFASTVVLYKLKGGKKLKSTALLQASFGTF